MIGADDTSDLQSRYLYRRANFLPWERKPSRLTEDCEAFKQVLMACVGAKHFGHNSFVSPDAHIYTESFEMGADSWVAAGAILRGHVKLGSNTTVNPFAHLAGHVRIGNGVRIGALASIYGFNHGYDSIDVPIYQQPHTSRGIVLEDDIWVGANAVIVDGVTIGAHSIVAGGAMVTTSFPEFSMLGRNPARLINTRFGNDA